MPKYKWNICQKTDKSSYGIYSFLLLQLMHWSHNLLLFLFWVHWHYSTDKSFVLLLVNFSETLIWFGCFPLKKQGKMSCLMINDIDAGLGRFGKLQPELRSGFGFWTELYDGSQLMQTALQKLSSIIFLACPDFSVFETTLLKFYSFSIFLL